MGKKIRKYERIYSRAARSNPRQFADWERDGMPQRYRFGKFEVRPLEGCVLRDGQAVTVGARALDVLVALIERRPRLVTKSELLDAVWAGRVVEEANVHVQVSILRKHLGAGVIATIPGRGYRFAVPLDGDEPAGTTDGLEGAVRDRPPGNLPPRSLPLLGRAGEMRTVAALVEECQVVTLVGPPGVGKTRLAQAVGLSLRERWPDGVWMIELAALTDPDLVPMVVAQALGLPPGNRDASCEGLAVTLRDQSLVLILDNCEHLLNSVTALVQALMRRACGVHVLATSQAILKVPGERVIRLSPLPVPPPEELAHAIEYSAVALFVDRVAALVQGFALDARNVEAVVDICRQLDGLPLALELAAGRVPLLGVAGLRDRLNARFRILMGGSRSALERHRTLHAALDWSHSLLTVQEQQIYRRVSVFAGGFTLEMATDVAGSPAVDEWALLEYLGGLVDKSLAVAADSGGTRRFHLLESARAYAHERLVEAGEWAWAQRRHAQCLARKFQDMRSKLLRGAMSIDAGTALALLEIDNLRIASRWAAGVGGDLEMACSLAVNSSLLLRFLGLEQEGQRRILELRDRVDGARLPRDLLANYWVALSMHAHRGGLPANERIELLQRAEEVYREIGDAVAQGFALDVRAHLHAKAGDFEAVDACFAQIQALARPDWPPALRGTAILRRGFVSALRGDFAAALSAYGSALDLFEQGGYSKAAFGLRVEIADLQLMCGFVEESIEAGFALAEIGRTRHRNGNVMGLVLMNLARALLTHGRLDEARKAIVEAMPHLRRSADIRAGCDGFAWLAALHGRFADAARLLGAAEAWAEVCGELHRPSERRSFASALALITQVCPVEQVDLWRKEGRLLHGGDVADLVLAGSAADRQVSRIETL
jgi:predicted ATPase/DNA-binding winged helix-turn-helix (wHTH) protein